MHTASAIEQFRLSEVISALSYALDITEGQPEGHAVRSCIIGLRIADQLQLSDERKAALFYALLLKDLGCSSNAAKMCWLFQADDRTVKRDIKLIDWSNLLTTASFSLQHVMPGASLVNRLIKVAGMVRRSEATSRGLIKVRCERGAEIARMIGFPEATAQAILELDEHFNGSGHPLGLTRQSDFTRRTNLFAGSNDGSLHCQPGHRGRCAVARERSNTWFNPELVKSVYWRGKVFVLQASAC